MKTGAMVFFTAFLALVASWAGFVLAPQIQLGRSSQASVLGSGELYPKGRPGLAKQGLEVYRANGCVHCHTQQVKQDGTHVEIILNDFGTNAAATFETLKRLNPELANVNPQEFFKTLPRKILEAKNVPAVEPALAALSELGVKRETHIVPTGPDIARGWGKRRTVAQDYVTDYPVQLGSRRIGPDLSNVGLRLPDANWHLQHLFAPRSLVADSTMPPYRFLFERRKIVGSPSPDALQLSGELAPPAGYEMVPTDDAKSLVAYLLSLKADAPLYEAPLTPAPAPAPATNAPAANTNAPAQ